jgi:hypothetical protein
MSLSPSPDSQLGTIAFFLNVGIRRLTSDREDGIKRINVELAKLAQVPEPEMRKLIGVVLSFMTDEDKENLNAVRDEISNALLLGKAE